MKKIFLSFIICALLSACGDNTPTSLPAVVPTKSGAAGSQPNLTATTSVQQPSQPATVQKQATTAPGAQPAAGAVQNVIVGKWKLPTSARPFGFDHDATIEFV